MNEGIKKGEGGEKKRMFSWMSPKLEVRETESCGKGVFTKEAIKKDETVAIFGGYIITLEEEESLPEEFKDHGVQISEEFVLTILEKEDMKDGYFNHSCNPNAGFNGQIFLVAMRDIQKDEEITFDYAMVLCKAKGTASGYSLQCSCGEENCRKEISENDWQIPELQKKYKGYFQYFLEKKIAEIKQS